MASDAKLEDNPYCSCVETAQQIYPKIPLQNAIEFKGNGTAENSEIVILQYPSKYEEGKFVYHIAPYKKEGEILHLYNEGNYEECQKTERDITIHDEEIIGYFDYDLWLKILELPQEAQDVLKCESHFQHYTSDGSLLQGKTKDYGIGQWTWDSWVWMNRKFNVSYQISNPYHQIEMMKLAWDAGLQKHWVCFNMLE